MATSTFPQEFHFSVWRGNSDEGADFTVSGEPDSDFTGYLGFLRVIPLRGSPFDVLAPAILGETPNVATFKPRFSIEETRRLAAGAVNGYEFELRNPGLTWQKTCFVGKINGLGGANRDD